MSVFTRSTRKDWRDLLPQATPELHEPVVIWPLTDPEIPAVLEALDATGGEVYHAANLAGVDRRRIQARKHIDSGFAERLDVIRNRERVRRLWEASCELSYATEALRGLCGHGDAIDVIVDGVFGPAPIIDPLPDQELDEILAARKRVGDARLAWARQLVAVYDAQDQIAGEPQENQYSLRMKYREDFEEWLEDDHLRWLATRGLEQQADAGAEVDR